MPTDVLPGRVSLTYLGDMLLEAMWTLKTTVTTGEGDADGTTYDTERAHKFRLAISPIDCTSTGHFVMEKEIVPAEINTFNKDDVQIEPTMQYRQAQVTVFDLRLHLKDIYNEDIVTNHAFHNHPVSVSLIALDSSGNVLGDAKFITNDHDSRVVQVITPHVLTPVDRPSKPTITQRISGDNKITLKFDVESSSSLLGIETHKVLVTVQESPFVSADPAHFLMSQYVLTPRSITRGAQSTMYEVEVVLEGEGKAYGTGKKIDNGNIYEFAVSMGRQVNGNNYVYSRMSDPVTAVGSNEPPRIETQNTHVTTNWTNPGSDAAQLWIGDISFGTVMSLADISFGTHTETWDGEVACTMHAEIFDVELEHADQIFWGVAPNESGDPVYLETDASGYVWKGMMSGRLDLKAFKNWDGQRNSEGNGYIIEMPIPRSWFSGDVRTIEVVARISQTTWNYQRTPHESVTKYGPNMTSSQTAHLVTNNQVTFNSTGPLSNGVTISSHDAITGDLRLSIAGTTLDTNTSLSVTYGPELEDTNRKTPRYGTFPITTSADGSFSGTSGLLKYNEVDIMSWTMSIEAVIDDPNRTRYQMDIQQFKTASRVSLDALKSPSGTMVASIHRTGPGEKPRCGCNVNDLSANLNGWMLKSVDLEVFEAANYGNIVVSRSALAVDALDGQFDSNTDLQYSDYPGNYDCKYTANLTLDNMSADARTLYEDYYGGSVPQPGLNIREAATSWYGPGTNYYNNPVITNVTIDGAGNMQIQGKTNGSTIEAGKYQSFGFIAAPSGDPNHYDFSVASAASAPTLTHDGQSGWNFDVTISHNEPLVLDPHHTPDAISSATGKIFSGFAVVDPSDAKSYIKISYAAE